jgi:D-proline reductase (dithiol) PrdB
MNLKFIKDAIYRTAFDKSDFLKKLWIKNTNFKIDSEIPWTPLKKELKDCKIALVTTAGLHHTFQEPFDMQDIDGDWGYREIDLSKKETFSITHNYYDKSDALKDINIVLPVDRINELVKEKLIGELNIYAYSFMGHILNQYLDKFINISAFDVAHKLKEQNVDIALLTPA